MVRGILLLRGRHKWHRQRRTQTYCNDKRTQVFSHISSVDLFAVASGWLRSPHAPIPEGRRSPSMSGGSLLYPYLHMRKSEGKSIMAKNDLSLSTDRSGWGAILGYTMQTAQIQHFQPSSYVRYRRSDTLACGMGER